MVLLGVVAVVNYSLNCVHLACLKQSLPYNERRKRGRRNRLVIRQTTYRVGSLRGRHREIHRKGIRSQGSDTQPLDWPYFANSLSLSSGSTLIEFKSPAI